MPGMYTQCPECLTIFKLGAAELAAAHGSVRCSHCNALFNALPSLSEQLPAEPIGRLDRHAEQLSPPQLGLPVFRPHRGTQGTLFLDPDDRPRAHERTASPAPQPYQLPPPQLGLPVFRPHRGTQGTLFLDPDDRPRAHERTASPPQFTRTHKPVPSRGNGIWVFGSFLLLALLAGEIAW